MVDGLHRRSIFLDLQELSSLEMFVLVDFLEYIMQTIIIQVIAGGVVIASLVVTFDDVAG